MTDQLLRVDAVRRHFPSGSGIAAGRSAPVRAVDGISFGVNAHETFSLVGESGCGKTTTAKMVLRLERPTDGTIQFAGQDIQHLDRSGQRSYHRSVQAVFQDPWSSLNPRMRAGAIVGEPLDILGGLSRAERTARVADSFTAVGLDSGLANSFPHEFSGGMRQRLALARALVTSPRLIVLDEPVSALDVSIRAQIMNLLRDIQKDFGVAYLLIAHNLATVRYLSHGIAAMYLGEIVEIGSSDQVLARPYHPYTAALVSASVARRPGSEKRPRIILEGDIPSPIRPPTGCRFHTRCWLYRSLGEPERCRIEHPEMRKVMHAQSTACHFAEEMPEHLGVETMRAALNSSPEAKGEAVHDAAGSGA